jgi:hypothetical protein
MSAYNTTYCSCYYYSRSDGLTDVIYRISNTNGTSFGFDFAVVNIPGLQNALTHDCCMRAGTSFKIFINGVQQGETQTFTGAMNFPSGAEKIGLQGNLNLPPSPPSALESLGSGMADTASQAGQGIKNLVGAGPQGLGALGQQHWAWRRARGQCPAHSH